MEKSMKQDDVAKKNRASQKNISWLALSGISKLLNFKAATFLFYCNLRRFFRLL
jgi:hypothetical protein